MDQGGVELLIPVLLEFDPAVKEIAAATLGNIAHHNSHLAQIEADRGAVQGLADLIQVCLNDFFFSIALIVFTSRLIHLIKIHSESSASG